MEQKDLEYYLSQIRRIAEHRETDAEEKIKEVYKKLKADLRHFVADYYADHGEDDRLSFEILNRKRQYARFIEEAVKITDDHLPEIREDIEKAVDDTYKITFDGMTDAVKRSVSSDELKEELKGIKAATPEQIRAGVLNDVSGITPEMTYTKDRATFIYELQKQLNIGLANGDRYTTMAKRISQRCDIAYRRSLLIARTETHRVREKGFLDSAEEINGTLESGSDPISLVKTWNSMEDERVRDTEKANHRVVDGVSVGVDDVFTLKGGVTAKAPGSSGTAYNDCNCRCFLSYEMKSVDKTSEKGYNKGRGEEVERENEHIGRSIGASAKNYPVRLPNGNHAKFAEGTDITKIKVFAGKGTNSVIREAIYLQETYHQPSEDWQKVRGEAIILENNVRRKVEVHWYEANGQKVKIKVKEYLDES